MVMPLGPQGAESMAVDMLETLVTRDSMIGVGVPKLP